MGRLGFRTDTGEGPCPVVVTAHQLVVDTFARVDDLFGRKSMRERGWEAG